MHFQKLNTTYALPINKNEMAKTTKPKTNAGTALPELEEVESFTPVKVRESAPDHSELIAIAVKDGRDLEYISKLMDLQDRWEAKLAKAEYAAAKGKFQNDIPTLVKSTNVNFPSKTGGKNIDYNYASLGDIGEAIKQPLYRNGLTYDWDIDDSGVEIVVTCIVTHIGGYVKRVTLRGKKDDTGHKNDMQQKASTITFLERYTLIAALGLTTASNDDDGRASGNVHDKHDGSDLLSLTDVQFKAAIKKVMSGEWNVEYLKSTTSLTEAQEQALKIAQDTFDGKPQNQ